MDVTAANQDVRSRAAGGTVTVWTQPPNIDHWDVERYPRSGRVLVQVSRGSLLLTILTESSVRLELGADGDAVMESTKDVPWDSLLSAGRLGLGRAGVWSET